MKKSKRVEQLYSNLRKRYDKPQGQWILWCKRPKTQKEKEEVIIGAILTQRTNWRNVELALANLKNAHLDSLPKISKIRDREKTRLVLLIEPSGFKRQKAKYLIGLARFIIKKYGSVSRMENEPAGKLRQELLNIKGIGPETADSILLYALAKPVFVIDEYTRRLVRARRLPAGGLPKGDISRRANYEELRQLFEKNLPRDWRLYQDFHALIVIDGKKR